MKYKVFVTCPIPDVGLSFLRRDSKIKLVVRKKDSVISRAELLAGVRGAHGLLCHLTDKIDVQVLRAGQATLKVISNYAVGFDNIDVVTANKFGIVVANTPVPEMSVAVAEVAVAFIFNLSTYLHQADAFTRAGKYHGFEPNLFVRTQIAGKTLGIVGLGRIGREVARRAVAMEMHLIYHTREPDPAFEHQYGATSVSLDQLLRQSDFVTLHVPLTPQTYHLIDAAALRKMKRTAHLINTSRGPVVDEKALVRALQKGEIAGAALDVYEHEPRLTPGLVKLSNVILTPHIASATRENREAMAVAATQNTLAVLHGRKPPFEVKRL